MRASSGIRCRRLSLVFGLLVMSTFVGCGVTGGWVMNNSGMGYYQSGNYAMARHEFQQAVALDPWNADYRHNLAMSLQKSGDNAQAERILRHNLTVNGAHQPTYHSLAKLMIDTGRHPEAEELLTTWAGTQPYNPDAYVELAWMQRETGNIPGAEQSLRHALQIDPNNSTAIANLGQVYQDAGEPMRATALYQQSLAMNFNQPEVQSRLATLAPGPGGSPMIGPGMASPAASNVALAMGSPLFGGGNTMMAGPGSMNGMPLPGFPPSGSMMSTYPSNQWQPVPPGWNAAPSSTPTLTPIPATSPTPIPAAPQILPAGGTQGASVGSESAGMPALPGVESTTGIPAGSRPVLTVPPTSLWQPTHSTLPSNMLVGNADPAHVPSDLATELPVLEPF